MPDLSAAAIKVNGETIEGFNNNTKAYSYLLKDNAKVPLVEASAVSKDIVVEIEQASKIPGTAIINLVDYQTYEKSTFLINFDRASVGDEFDQSELKEQWQWLRENKTNHKLDAQSGVLTLTTEPGTSLKTATTPTTCCCRVRTTTGPLRPAWWPPELPHSPKMQALWPIKTTIIL